MALKSAKDLALLAGRKLLLADDSITIQKVVDLTFADEGVKVICVGNGREAIDKLEEVGPDIVLADVFMPQVSGYQVCEYIKGNEKLKHIPVMLLVGSFEPFDEAEARRVGADDILTKPFQSIRKLIDKVGGLVGGHPPETSVRSQEAPTAELPRTEEVTPEPERLSTADLELTTADTQRLPDHLKSLALETIQAASTQKLAHEPSTDTTKMETSYNPSEPDLTPVETGDVLLDLGDDFAPSDDAIDQEFVLDLDESEESEPAGTSASRGQFVEPEIAEAAGASSDSYNQQSFSSTSSYTGGGDLSGTFSDQRAPTQEFVRPGFASGTSASSGFERVTDDVDNFSSAGTPERFTSSSGKITLEQLSPEAIDAIARRAVELMSERVVKEIAWEVVPELAELLIKRQLEEKKH